MRGRVATAALIQGAEWHGEPSPIVEDPDAPAGQPLVHAIVWDMSPDERRIEEGAIGADGAGGTDGDVGRNSILREGLAAPDPSTGHDLHDYVFQLFALSERVDLDASSGCSAFVQAIQTRVSGAAVLIGTSSLSEPMETDAPSANNEGSFGAAAT